MFSEFSWNVAMQMEVKITLLSYALASISEETMANLDVSDIQEVLRSCAHDKGRLDNYLKRECPVCGGTFPRSRIEQMYLCDHYMCLECAQTYYRVAIKDVRDAESLNVLTCYERHPIPTVPEERINFFNHLQERVRRSERSPFSPLDDLFVVQPMVSRRGDISFDEFVRSGSTSTEKWNVMRMKSGWEKTIRTIPMFN